VRHDRSGGHCRPRCASILRAKAGGGRWLDLARAGARPMRHERAVPCGTVMNNHANSRRAGSCRRELHDGLGLLAGVIVVEPVVVVVRIVFGGGPPSQGGLVGIQQSGSCCRSKPGRWRSLSKVLDAAIRVLAEKGASQLVQLATLGQLGPGGFQRASVLRTRFVYPATVRVARAQPSTIPAQLAHTKNQPNWALALGPQ